MRESRYLDTRPDFDGAFAGPRNPGGDAYRLVEILGVNHEEAAELLARLRKRTVGHEPLAITHPDAGCRRDWVQRSRGQILPVRVKILRELSGLHVTLLPLGLVQGVLVKVNQQHVFHLCASIT